MMSMEKYFLSALTTMSHGSIHEGVGWNIFYYSGMVFITILIFAWLARLGFTSGIPRSLPTKLAEHLYVFIEDMCLSVIGPHGRKYISYIMGLWLIIFTSNTLGLILPYTPTAELSLNLSLSIMTMLYVQYEGIRAHGFFGHMKHFAGPKLAWFMAIFITPLLFAIELVSEVMKVLSLALRLYSNIEGGHKVVVTLNDLFMDGQWPIGGVLIALKFLSCIIQSLVFVLLACVYLSIVTRHDESDESTLSGSESDHNKENTGVKGITLQTM